MKPIIIYNNFIPFKGFKAMAFYPFIFVRGNSISSTAIYHEKIRFEEQKDLLLIFFYIWYIVEYLIRLIQYRNFKVAYRNISFEREAYLNQNNFDYIENRKRFNFVKYLNYGKV